MNISKENAESPPVDDDGNTQQQFEAKLARLYDTRKKKPSPMRKEAFFGMVGDVVELLAQGNEPCKESYLIQFLVAIGNMLGRKVLFQHATWQHANLYAVLVGETGESRKGTSRKQQEELHALIDKAWKEARVRGGIQTGEAMVMAVRDSREKPTGKTSPMGEMVTVTDSGVSDKRLLLMEEEYSRLLKVAHRKENTLADYICKGWDGDKHLSAESKTDAIQATDAHISIIGHITPDALRKLLHGTEVSNGFVNRFIWSQAYMTKRCSRPKMVDWSQHSQLVGNLKGAVESAKAGLLMRFTAAAENVYDHWYNTRKRPTGMMAEVLERAEMHVIRMAMIYAALDCRDEIDVQHLDAARAVWEYSERLARAIFGDGLENSLDGKILWILQRQGERSRTKITAELGNRHGGTELSQALARLRASGQADCTGKPGNDGRLIECWHAIATDQN